MRRTPKRTRERGQVLVMFVGSMIGLLALAALAIDLSSVYSTQQTEKAAADAAALAGAQDLQVAGSRVLGDLPTVRKHALEDLIGRFGLTANQTAIEGQSTCATSSQITHCPLTGTPYVVAISTQAKTPTTSDPFSVQVSVTIPNFQLSVAHLFGQNSWNVGETSVAVLQNPGQYAAVTLRPPNPNQTSDSNASDITINGSSGALNVYDGDIGTNTSVRPAPGTISFNSTDYYVRYFDTTAGWGSSPQGKPILSLIPDPKYPYPVEDSSTLLGGYDSSSTTCGDLLTAFNSSWYAIADATYTAANTVCYKPGVYTGPAVKTLSAETFPNKTLSILEPGVYFFDGGMDIKGTVVGGIVPGSPGVAVLVPQTKSIKMSGTPPLFALNMGTYACLTPTNCTGTQAKAATWSGSWSDGVTTRAANSPVVSTTKNPLPLSVIVPGDPGCPVVMPAPACDSTAYQTLDYSGAGSVTVVAIVGVQYAPSDNAKIAGNGGAYSYEGQIVSWTVTYTGNSVISEHYGTGVGNAVVRLDTTCSGGGSTCNP